MDSGATSSIYAVGVSVDAMEGGAELVEKSSCLNFNRFGDRVSEAGSAILELVERFEAGTVEAAYQRREIQRLEDLVVTLRKGSPLLFDFVLLRLTPSPLLVFLFRQAAATGEDSRSHTVVRVRGGLHGFVLPELTLSVAESTKFSTSREGPPAPDRDLGGRGEPQSGGEGQDIVNLLVAATQRDDGDRNDIRFCATKARRRRRRSPKCKRRWPRLLRRISKNLKARGKAAFGKLQTSVVKAD